MGQVYYDFSNFSGMRDFSLEGVLKKYDTLQGDNQPSESIEKGIADILVGDRVGSFDHVPYEYLLRPPFMLPSPLVRTGSQFLFGLSRRMIDVTRDPDYFDFAVSDFDLDAHVDGLMELATIDRDTYASIVCGRMGSAIKRWCRTPIQRRVSRDELINRIVDQLRLYAALRIQLIGHAIRNSFQQPCGALLINPSGIEVKPQTADNAVGKVEVGLDIALSRFEEAAKPSKKISSKGLPTDVKRFVKANHGKLSRAEKKEAFGGLKESIPVIRRHWILPNLDPFSFAAERTPMLSGTKHFFSLAFDGVTLHEGLAIPIVEAVQFEQHGREIVAKYLDEVDAGKVVPMPRPLPEPTEILVAKTSETKVCEWHFHARRLFLRDSNLGNRTDLRDEDRGDEESLATFQPHDRLGLKGIKASVARLTSWGQRTFRHGPVCGVMSPRQRAYLALDLTYDSQLLS